MFRLLNKCYIKAGAALILCYCVALSTALAADTSSPISTHTFTPSVPDGNNSWYVSSVGVLLESTDLESGVASIHWKLNDGSWQEEAFSQTLNLAPNSSFEFGSDSAIDSWEFLGTEGAASTQTSTQAYLDTYSAEITTTQSGWSGWNNASDYVVVSPWEHFTASMWVKTQDVTGFGAYFRVYALSPAGDTEISVSDSQVSGTTDWTKLTSEFVVSVSDAYGLYLDLGLNGTGTVWLDAVTVNETWSEISTSFTISQNGEHTLEYYGVDRYGNEEIPHKTADLKIDTVAPGGWCNFSTTRFGNEHTLISTIDVTDATSGLDPGNLYYQYSVDAGISWGYYWMFLTCWDWSWVEDGWLPAGWDLPTLITLPTNYCDSNWSKHKTIRFEVSDMAGNTGTKDICINGSWIQAVGGDIYSGAGITMQTAGMEDNADGVVYTANNILENFSTESSLIVTEYEKDIKPTFESFYNRFLPRAVVVTELPSQSGVYLIESSFTIDNGTIPSDLDTADFGAVVLVDGDLTINRDYEFGSDSGIVFVVFGDVCVDKNVEETHGFFIADGNFNTCYNGGSNVGAWTLYGSIVADSIGFPRSLHGESASMQNPAEKIIFQPKYFDLVNTLLGISDYSWEEVEN